MRQISYANRKSRCIILSSHFITLRENKNKKVFAICEARFSLPIILLVAFEQHKQIVLKGFLLACFQESLWDEETLVARRLKP